MNITQIYTKYKIMPSLQLHMLRVAGVAQVICENFQNPKLINAENIVIACLLHDMGNIIKFDLNLFPQFLEPNGFNYWKNVQDQFIDKYGTDEHIANYAIAKELGVSEQILKLVQSVGFSNSESNYYSDDFNCKISAYADFRVAPLGVDLLKNRLEDGRQRFKINKMHTYDPKKDKFEELVKFIEQIEAQIFEKCALEPAQITETLVLTKLDELKKLQLSLEL